MIVLIYFYHSEKISPLELSGSFFGEHQFPTQLPGRLIKQEAPGSGRKTLFLDFHYLTRDFLPESLSSVFNFNVLILPKPQNSHLNLDTDVAFVEKLELGGNKALVPLGERVVYCNNEKETLIMECYRELMGRNPKVKRKELWEAVVSASDETMNDKMFDLILRQFCYTQGANWLPKPKP